MLIEVSFSQKNGVYVGAYDVPAGGLGLPPNTEVMRRMNVDLPQPAERVERCQSPCQRNYKLAAGQLDMPESAASPITIVFSAALTSTTDDPRL